MRVGFSLSLPVVAVLQETRFCGSILGLIDSGISFWQNYRPVYVSAATVTNGNQQTDGRSGAAETLRRFALDQQGSGEWRDAASCGDP
ncbi:hypothetical protein NDU88_002312 [Pleurodeles waltl]|uniref:Secreted protein n=1 Tax=Pleurodeles waltl TaxID=8319 RepID=A0AAV7T205_PLEWA|nr:hypothetical protein NDU88_002312 [Pleurodeles waltl]